MTDDKTNYGVWDMRSLGLFIESLEEGESVDLEDHTGTIYRLQRTPMPYIRDALKEMMEGCDGRPEPDTTSP